MRTTKANEAEMTSGTTGMGGRARTSGLNQASARHIQHDKRSVEGAGHDKRSVEGAGGDEFVAQCRRQAQALGERKLEQEQRLNALIEGSFGQLEQIFNALLQTAQEVQTADQTQFEEASAVLEGNLDRHEQVATKLRAIMAILTGASSQ